MNEEPPTPAGEEEEPRPRERVLWNTIAIVVARVLGDVFQVLAALRMAAHLTKNEWGLFGYLRSSIEVYRVLANFGLDIIAVRVMALRQHGPWQIIRHLLALKTVLASVVLAGALAASFFVTRQSEHRGLLMLLSGGIFFVAYKESIKTRFQTEHMMDRLIPVNFIAGALFFGAVVAASSLGARLGPFVGVWVGFELLFLLLTVAAWRLTWREPSGLDRGARFDPRLAGILFRQGIPVGMLALICMLYSRLGIFLLEYYADLAAVGQYFIAIKVTEPLLAVAGALSMSAFPVLSRLAERGEIAELKGRFVRYSVRAALVSFAVAAALTPSSGWLLAVVKPEFAAASGALIALAWATAFMFQNQLSTTVINSFGKYHYVTGFAAFNLVTFLCFSTYLIPRYGVTGAGLSTLGTEGINTLVQLVAVTLLLRRAGRQRSGR